MDSKFASSGVVFTLQNVEDLRAGVKFCLFLWKCNWGLGLYKLCLTWSDPLVRAWIAPETWTN
jgi:hypothetical protein